MPSLTPKQQLRVAQATGPTKSALLRGYAKQNAGAKPTPKAKPAPKRQSKPQAKPNYKPYTGSTHAIQRGVGYYDAFRNPPGNIAFPASMGEATPLRSVCRFTTPSGAGDVSNAAQLIIVFNDVAGAAVARCYNIADKANGDPPEETLYKASQFESIDKTIPFIPTRQSVRITNTTQVVQRGGVVRFLRVNNLGNRLRMYPNGSFTDATHPNRVTVGHVKEMMEMIRESPKSRTLGAAELGKPRQWNAYITDLVGSSTFVERTLPGAEGWTTAASGEWDFASAAAQPMSILCFLIEPHSTENNTFEVAIMSQRLYRFPYGSLLSSFSRDVGHMSHETAHKLKSTEEHHENNAGTLVEAAALTGAALAAKLAGVKAASSAAATAGETAAPSMFEMAALAATELLV